MRTWLKGGLIGGGIMLLIIILNAFFGEFPHPYFLKQFFSGVYAVLEMPIKGVINSIMDDEWGLTTATFSVPFYFGIGALIGFIIGRFRRKKK